MTTQDKNNIKRLYYFHRYNAESIGKLYGLTASRIKQLLPDNKTITFSTLDECLLCGLDYAKAYFIDGNSENNKPQNVIMLCERDKRRLEHLQIRKHRGTLITQY